MKPLFTNEEFIAARKIDKLPCECYSCGQVFYKDKHTISKVFRKVKGHSGKFCSKECQIKTIRTSIHTNCAYCNKPITVEPNQVRRSKNNFCSRSCLAYYHNKNKTHGNKRSKLEIYIENQLTQLYPNLHIDYNKTSAIGSELDIYIPSLNIAFELNGIFHYEPIYGVNTLEKIQKRDISKSKACHDAKIDLCIIDTSGQKYFKESTSKKYLDIITNIINQRTNI